MPSNTQVLYPFPRQLELVERIHARFGAELPAHLEFARIDGKVTCFGVPLVRFTTEAGKCGGMYISHIRDEADKTFEALNEAIRIGREARLPVARGFQIQLAEVALQRLAAHAIAAVAAAMTRGIVLLESQMIGEFGL